jgi:hypothetical protein
MQWEAGDLFSLLPLFALVILMALNVARDPSNTRELRHASANCNNEIIVGGVAVEAIVVAIALIEGRKTITSNLNGSGEGLSVSMIVPLNGCGNKENNSIQSSKLAAEGAVSKFKAGDNIAACDESLQVSGLDDPRGSTKLELEGAIRDCIALVESDRLQNCNYGPVDAQLSPTPFASPWLGGKKFLEVGRGSPIERLRKMHRGNSGNSDVVGAHTMDCHFHGVERRASGWSLKAEVNVMHTRPGASVNFHSGP